MAARTIWKIAPFQPLMFSVAAPSMTTPMWLTDEYAMMYLRSFCDMAESAP